jgi:hypothetical protein
MTPQEWKEVEESLKSFYSLVKLRCDKYEITLCLERQNQFKNAIMIYVNGKIQWKWATQDCEERRRFWKPVHRYVHTQKVRAGLKKMSKRLRVELGDYYDPNKKFTYYTPMWTSFRALKNHLIKNNHKIELIKEESNANRSQTESPDSCGQDPTLSR